MFYASGKQRAIFALSDLRVISDFKKCLRHFRTVRRLAAGKVEDEVLEAAEAEQRGEQMGVPEIESPENADSPEPEGPSLAQAAASPEQDDEPEQEPESAEENSAAAWTDEQLLSAGWTQEQIDAMRNG